MKQKQPRTIFSNQELVAASASNQSFSAGLKSQIFNQNKVEYLNIIQGSSVQRLSKVEGNNQLNPQLKECLSPNNQSQLDVSLPNSFRYKAKRQVHPKYIANYKTNVLSVDKIKNRKVAYCSDIVHLFDQQYTANNYLYSSVISDRKEGVKSQVTSKERTIQNRTLKRQADTEKIVEGTYCLQQKQQTFHPGKDQDRRLQRFGYRNFKAQGSSSMEMRSNQSASNRLIQNEVPQSPKRAGLVQSLIKNSSNLSQQQKKNMMSGIKIYQVDNMIENPIMCISMKANDPQRKQMVLNQKQLNLQQDKMHTFSLSLPRIASVNPSNNASQKELQCESQLKELKAIEETIDQTSFQQLQPMFQNQAINQQKSFFKHIISQQSLNSERGSSLITRKLRRDESIQKDSSVIDQTMQEQSINKIEAKTARELHTHSFDFALKAPIRVDKLPVNIEVANVLPHQRKALIPSHYKRQSVLIAQSQSLSTANDTSIVSPKNFRINSQPLLSERKKAQQAIGHDLAKLSSELMAKNFKDERTKIFAFQKNLNSLLLPRQAQTSKSQSIARGSNQNKSQDLEEQECFLQERNINVRKLIRGAQQDNMIYKNIQFFHEEVKSNTKDSQETEQTKDEALKEIEILKLKLKLTDNILNQPTVNQREDLYIYYMKQLNKFIDSKKDHRRDSGDETRLLSQIRASDSEARLVNFLVVNKSHFLSPESLKKGYRIQPNMSAQFTQYLSNYNSQLSSVNGGGESALDRSVNEEHNESRQSKSTKEYLQSVRGSEEFQTNRQKFITKKTIMQVVKYMQQNQVVFDTFKVPEFKFS